jgi:membrane associated rhomboid family serine protease
MIPLRDVIPSRTLPGVTLALIAANALAFVYELSLGRDLEPFLAAHGLVPARFSVEALLTSLFLHQSVVHVGGTMLYLWLFADNLEDRMGHGRFAAFYLLCGTAAAAAHAIAHPDSRVPLVGASGAVAGVLGAYFVLYPRSKIVTLLPMLPFLRLVEVPAVFFLGVWVLLQFAGGAGSLAGAAGGIASWAHLAGFGTGAAAVRLFRRPERQRVEWWNDA